MHANVAIFSDSKDVLGTGGREGRTFRPSLSTQTDVRDRVRDLNFINILIIIIMSLAPRIMISGRANRTGEL
jgi:hypothetical protein